MQNTSDHLSRWIIGLLLLAGLFLLLPSPGVSASSPAQGIPFIDSDGDGVEDWLDKCPGISNFGSQDQDGDGVLDMCDLDIDNDGVMEITTS